MMGHRQVEQAALFYEFSLEKHVPRDHLLRSIDRFVELDEVRRELAGFYIRPARIPSWCFRSNLHDEILRANPSPASWALYLDATKFCPMLR